MLSLVMIDLRGRRKTPLERARKHYRRNLGWKDEVGERGEPTSRRRRDAVEQLDAIKGGQPFLQRHGELVREAPPVLVSHLVLESVKDLKPNTSSSSFQGAALKMEGPHELWSLSFPRLANRGQSGQFT